MTLLAQSGQNIAVLVAAIVFVLIWLIILVVFTRYFGLWFRAYMSNAHVSLLELIGMSLRRVNPRVIVQAKIMVRQAGMGPESENGITTRRLEAHHLIGGNVPDVVRAMIAAHRAGIDLDFEQAAALDLAGHDVLELVRSSAVTGKPLPRPIHSGARHPSTAPPA